MSYRTLVVGLLASALVVSASAISGEHSKQQVLIDEASLTIDNFADAPEMEWFRDNVDNAKAVLILPNQVRGGFIVGGSGGSGVLLFRDGDHWTYPAFYSMGSATFGFQAGGEVSELVLLVMTEAGKTALLGTSLKLGGDIAVAAGPIGVGAKAQTADILAFARSKGLYGGLNVEGAAITPRDEWNEIYYGRALSPSEILVEQSVAKTEADTLRIALDGLSESEGT